MRYYLSLSSIITCLYYTKISNADLFFDKLFQNFVLYSILAVMAYNIKFGPAAQTPAQRAWVLAQMQRMIPSLGKNVTSYTQHLYDRYIAGELSWQEVQQARESGKDF